MTKLRTFFIVATSLVVGAAIGVFATYQYQNFINRIFLSATAGEEVDAMVRVLRKLRESKTDGAIERLEGRLDDALLRLGASYDTGPRIVPAALEAARKYRTEFPRKTTSEYIDATVAKTLLISNDQKR